MEHYGASGPVAAPPRPLNCRTFGPSTKLKKSISLFFSCGSVIKWEQLRISLLLFLCEMVRFLKKKEQAGT